MKVSRCSRLNEINSERVESSVDQKFSRFWTQIGGAAELRWENFLEERALWGCPCFCVPLGSSDWAARFSALAQIIFKKRYYKKLAIRKRFETRAWLATRVYTLVIMKNTIYQRKRRKRMNLWEIFLLVGFTTAERGNLIYQTIFIIFFWILYMLIDKDFELIISLSGGGFIFFYFLHNFRLNRYF